MQDVQQTNTSMAEPKQLDIEDAILARWEDADEMLLRFRVESLQPSFIASSLSRAVNTAEIFAFFSSIGKEGPVRLGHS